MRPSGERASCSQLSLDGIASNIVYFLRARARTLSARKLCSDFDSRQRIRATAARPPVPWRRAVQAAEAEDARIDEDRFGAYVDQIRHLQQRFGLAGDVDAASVDELRAEESATPAQAKPEPPAPEPPSMPPGGHPH